MITFTGCIRLKLIGIDYRIINPALKVARLSLACGKRTGH